MKTHRVAAVPLLASALLAGCQSPGEYRREADQVAYRIIEDKQLQGLGKTEPFTVEQPADTLRRRLMLDQGLPYSDPASLGSLDMEVIPQWPDDGYLDPDSRPQLDPVVSPSGESGTWNEPVRITLFDALQIAARSSRTYQDRKDAVFLAALDLDLERDFFRPVFGAGADASATADLTDGDTFAGVEGTGSVSVTQRFRNGMTLTGLIGVDLVKLLTDGKDSSLGVFGDASVSIPLLRGAGEFITTESLTRAERNALYAIYQFENFKREFAVNIADQYLGVLQQLDRVDNAEENYRRLIASARRARALEQTGEFPPIQVDQAVQDELRARERWVAAEQSFENALDSFKLTLGLPTDANIDLARDELTRLASAVEDALLRVTIPEPTEEPETMENVPLLRVPAADASIDLTPPTPEEGGPFEMEEALAIELALEHRLDLRVAQGRIVDAQRAVAIAADRLRPELTLLGRVATGERRGLGTAGLSDSTSLPLDRATYNALMTLDLPLERTAERNLYRESFIALEQAIRNLQELEDQVKFQIRAGLRELLVSREGVRIQAQAVQVATRRVEASDLLLRAGRVDIREVLEAQEDLVSAQNALTNALVGYRVAELELQRDLGLLEVDEAGLWQEVDPADLVAQISE